MSDEKHYLNPFSNPEIVSSYEKWYETTGRRVDRKEKVLLKWLLAWFPHAHTILEAGCGTGHFTRWFAREGLEAVGLDLSWPMLVDAQTRGSTCYVRGDAQYLPFRDGAFDLVAMVTTLAFLPDPEHALEEALRVARQGLILGVLNAQSLLGREYKRIGGPVWEVARLLTLSEIKRMINKIAEERLRVFWRCTLLPFWPWPLALPYGGFIGLAVRLD